MNEKETYTKVVCPQCGKALAVRILELQGRLRYSVRCPECKKVSEVVIEKNI